MQRTTLVYILGTLLFVGCGSEPPPEAQQQGPAACMQETRGICEEWLSPPDGAEASCSSSEGSWVFPSCLTLDAIASCTAGDRSSQVFYSSNSFTLDAARAQCSTRSGFTFTAGNERTVLPSL